MALNSVENLEERISTIKLDQCLNCNTPDGEIFYCSLCDSFKCDGCDNEQTCDTCRNTICDKCCISDYDYDTDGEGREIRVGYYTCKKCIEN